MENSEKTINPVLDGAENTDPNNTNDGFEINLGDSSPIQEENHDLADVFSSDATENSNTISTESPSNEVNPSPETLEDQSIIPEEPTESVPQEVAIENIQEEAAPQLTEAPNPVPEPEPMNNEVILGKFDNKMISQTEAPSTPQFLDNTLLDHPAVLDESPIAEANTEDQEKVKLAQKAKLAQLVKTHESKAHNKGLMTGIFSGVIVTAGIFVLAGIFAKDQIINVLNTISGESTLSASVMDLSENPEENNPDVTVNEENPEDIEDIPDIEEFDDSELDENIDENVDSEYVKNDSDEYSEESDNSEYTEVTDKNTDEYTDSEYIKDDSDEYSEKSDNSEYTEVTDENIGYTITHVDSETKANWVMPAHCSDLTCYGEDKEFTPCTTFRLSENLDENAHRIGNNGVCRYKDISELVYVEIK